MSKKLNSFRNNKSWFGRLSIAWDKMPGTPLDHKILLLRQTIEAAREGLPDLNYSDKERIDDFGIEMAIAVADGNAQLFHDYADAIERFKNHVPDPDKIRATIVLCCMRRKSYTILEIVHHLQSKKLVPPRLDTDSYKNLRKKIERICKECGIRISGKVGRPKIGQGLE